MNITEHKTDYFVGFGEAVRHSVQKRPNPEFQHTTLRFAKTVKQKEKAEIIVKINAAKQKWLRNFRNEKNVHLSDGTFEGFMLEHLGVAGNIVRLILICSTLAYHL